MTVINIIRRQSSVIVISDGLAIPPANSDFHRELGVESGFLVSKVFPVPHLDLVMAVRGLTTHLVELAYIFQPLGGTYDEVKASIPTLREWWEKQHGLRETLSDIFIAGISAKSGPDSFMVATHGHNPDTPAWTVFDLGEFWLSPGSADLTHRYSLEAKRAIDPGRLARLAVEIVEDQRRQTVERPDGTSFLASEDTGGFVQITTIERGSITSKIVHRWA